jgi:hypothetical protein
MTTQDIIYTALLCLTSTAKPVGTVSAVHDDSDYYEGMRAKREFIINNNPFTKVERVTKEENKKII